MLTKLLLIAGVVVLVVVAFKNRDRATATQTSQNQSHTSPPSPARITAWTLIGVIVTLSVGLAIYQQATAPATEHVTVLVVNTHSGEQRRYRVPRDQAGERRFQTSDGRIIVLAATDRAEVIEEP